MKAVETKQEDLQYLGTFGIFKESFKLIFTWRKIFLEITLALLFPLSCLSLIYYGISKFLNNKIVDNTSNTNSYSSISLEWTVYWLLINVTYLIISLFLSFFSISAVVYTITYVYTDRELTFKRVVKVVPKVWKQLMITYLCKFGIIFAYTFIFVFATLILVGVTMACISYKSSGGKVGLATLVIISTILFLIGLFYLSIVWLLANVVSVMEKICGMQAMSRSKELMKGKMGTSIGVIFILALCSLPNYLLIKQLGEPNDVKSICYGILSSIFMTFLYLLNLVVQTVLYFVCKSYHHEIVEKSSLAIHLGEYLPLDTTDLQQQDHQV